MRFRRIFGSFSTIFPLFFASVFKFPYQLSVLSRCLVRTRVGNLNRTFAPPKNPAQSESVSSCSLSDWSEFVGGGVQNAAARERRASAALRSSQYKQPNASDSVARADAIFPPHFCCRRFCVEEFPHRLQILQWTA